MCLNYNFPGLELSCSTKVISCSMYALKGEKERRWVEAEKNITHTQTPGGNTHLSDGKGWMLEGDVFVASRQACEETALDS